MTASISLPARGTGRVSADRFADFGPLFRKDLREWLRDYWDDALEDLKQAAESESDESSTQSGVARK